ncbi:MAG: alpha-amylase/4-alpha-glucanotransferase domain-containing protein [Anaerolineae bacterium]
MTPKIYLSLVFHNHQPVGNFENVFAEAYEKSYLPLIEILERHPKIRVAMHFTGCLRDWILDQHPELYARARDLVEAGQLEILGGAYYEPILVMLSDDDKIGQIRLLSDSVEADFGQRAQGMWLAERVWEPSLARPIAQAGLRYAVVDDTHFKFTGFTEEELFGYYVTEEQGYMLNMFPSSTALRYMLPWSPVEQILDWLREQGERLASPVLPPALAVMGDDGEKFGMWPGTFEHCWQNGYMDKLFSAIEASGDWLETTTPGEYMRQYPARGRAYLPTASYLEMTEWALPAERMHEIKALRLDMDREIDSKQHSDPGRAEYVRHVQRYLRGGFWRNFLTKYPEVNQMQKRGMYTSRRIHALPDGDAKADALKHLWASQCNCAYWHGVFGGIYLFHIRAANYANLLDAEALILDDQVRAELIDFDLDSHSEIVISSDPFSLVISTAFGGAIYEWDDIPSRYNLLNIMTRRREGYHIDLQEAAARNDVITPEMPQWSAPDWLYSTTVRAKQLGLERDLVVDWHRRGALIDHFLGDDVTLDQFRRADYSEAGDFVLGGYTAEVGGSGTNVCTVTLRRDGNVWIGGRALPVRVEKRLTITAGVRELLVEYAVTNLASVSIKTRFGIETSYGFDGGNTEMCYLAIYDGDTVGMGQAGTSASVGGYRLGTQIRGFEVDVMLARAGALWRFPLEPVTMSEGGYERIHQGTVLLHVFPLDLAPGATWENVLRLKIDDLRYAEVDDSATLTATDTDAPTA